MIRMQTILTLNLTVVTQNSSSDRTELLPMKQVVARAGRVEVIDLPIPSMGENEILVKTLYSVISSGTETWTIQATQPIGTDDILSNRSKLRKAIDLSSKVLGEEGLSGLIDY